MKYFLILFSLMIIFSTSNAFAQDIPSWVKNSAGWWADGQIDDQTFTKGIEFLINEEIIQIGSVVFVEEKSEQIPPWIKNSAGWWAQDIITDHDFLNGIQYLVSNGIISVSLESKTSENLVIGGFDLSNAGPLEGQEDAEFTIIMFTDHQCEKCVNWLIHEKQVISEKLINSGIVKFVILDYPMLGEDSVSAAEAAYCAQEQGSYFEYLGILKKKYSGVQNGWANLDALIEYAKGLELDSDAFESCLFWDQQAIRVDHNKKVALAHGVVGTPTFFVIDSKGEFEKIAGSQPAMVFESVIKEMS